MNKWQAKLVSALNEVNLDYSLGCMEFYAKKNLDPWQTEHDILESNLKVGNDVSIKQAIDNFETRCKELLSEYRK